MGYWHGLAIGYHEGDKLYGDIATPKRPDATYVWNGTAWVQDPALAQAAHNAPYQEQLNANDLDSMRSVRTLVVELAKVSLLYPPTFASERYYLITNESTATQARAQIEPPHVPTLDEAKAQRIFELRIQLFAYIRLGFIWSTFRWSCDVTDMIVYLSLAGYQVSGNLLTTDSRLHLWDANNAEHILTPLNAGKLAGALYQWLYLAQAEAQAKANEVKACTTVAQVQAVTWTGVYTNTSPYNADLKPAQLPFPGEPPPEPVEQLPDAILL